MKRSPQITVTVRSVTLAPAEMERLGGAVVGIVAERKRLIFQAIHLIVKTWGKEPKAGFVTNELSVALADGLEVSVEGRTGKGTGVAIARLNGQIVAHQFTGEVEFGEWTDELKRKAEIAKRREDFNEALPDYFNQPPAVGVRSDREREDSYLMADAA